MNLTDGQWNHICLVRYDDQENGNGTRFYCNGKLTYTLFDQTSVMYSGGTFIIGQDLNVTDGSFNESRAFVGMITQVNLWSKWFDHNDVASLSRACWGIPGDVIQWSDFIDGIYGDIQLLNTSECRMPGRSS